MIKFFFCVSVYVWSNTCFYISRLLVEPKLEKVQTLYLIFVQNSVHPIRLKDQVDHLGNNQRIKMFMNYKTILKKRLLLVVIYILSLLAFLMQISIVMGMKTSSQNMNPKQKRCSENPRKIKVTKKNQLESGKRTMKHQIKHPKQHLKSSTTQLGEGKVATIFFVLRHSFQQAYSY